MIVVEIYGQLITDVGNSNSGRVQVTTAKFRDPSLLVSHCFAVDTTQGTTAANRVKIILMVNKKLQLY
jgi:hypothetical protein